MLALVEQHIRGLDVTVDESALMGGIEAPAPARPPDRPGGQRPLRESAFRSEPSTRRIAMYSCPSISPASWIGTTFGCSSGRHPRLGKEALAERHVVCEVWASSFSATSRSSASRGAVHDAHPAATDQRLDP